MCVEVFVKLFHCFFVLFITKMLSRIKMKFVLKKSVFIVKNKNVISIGYVSHSFHVFR